MLAFCPGLIYNGFYIISEKIDYKSIAEKLQSEVFLDFVKLLGKYKNGGYYTFSTKDVKKIFRLYVRGVNEKVK